VTLGVPTIAGATVAAEVLEQARGPKVIAFKKRRRKNSRRKRGHRQEFTLVRITEILTDGKKANKTPPPRPKRAPKPAPATEDGPASAATETGAPAAASTGSKKRKTSAHKAPARKAPARKPEKRKSKAPAVRAKKPAPKGKKK
jgi:large subunit ribosomal protein L21